MRFWGVKITSTLDDYLPSGVNTIKRETAFKSIYNPGKWYLYCYRQKFNTKGVKNHVHHVLPTGARPVPAN